jgi:hypothetical protein
MRTEKYKIHLIPESLGLLYAANANEPPTFMVGREKKFMTSLKLTGVALLILISTAFVSLPRSAGPQGGRELTATETTSKKATIVSIDKAKRIVTLRGPQGEDWTVYADERVQRFNELKVGDVITASYSQALAVRIRKPGAPAPKEKAESLVRDAEKIGATVTKEQTVSVTVQEIDIPNTKITVKNTDGKTMSFKVRDKDNLRELKVGDKVDVTYTEALLLRADRAQ